MNRENPLARLARERIASYRYRKLYVPGHPKAGRSGQLDAHLVIAERALGHAFPPGAQVHHVDEDTRNNARTNLVICQDQAYHLLLHVRTRIVRAGGNPNTDLVCSSCHRAKPAQEFNRATANLGTGRQTACRSCAQQWWMNEKLRQAITHRWEEEQRRG